MNVEQIVMRKHSLTRKGIFVIMQITPRSLFIHLLEKDKPQAMAWIQGNKEHSKLSGLAKFYATKYAGVLVEAEIFGLPDEDKPLSTNFYAFHIHEFGNCSNGFMNTGEHYNPMKEAHPRHAGDLVPLMGNNGYAWLSFYDTRFKIWEIIGKSVIIHSQPDDFTSQPSGNAGEKIGCGVIRSMKEW